MTRAICCILLFLVLGSLGVAGRAADHRQFPPGEVPAGDDTARKMPIRSEREAERCRMAEIVLAQALPIESANGTLGFPGCRLADRHVWALAEVAPWAAGQFAIEKREGCGMASRSDPTGVRSRLLRDRGNRAEGEMCR